ncbi:NlpC/P60 family protein [Pedobacter antarcticus]|uniref:C40 family peptidase n=1 Tax=Pedobacter antarcticus TaxID=34086 RepID=UPI001C57B7B5|nr:C40 family peptidase [Pedobacter antarcticus]
MKYSNCLMVLLLGGSLNALAFQSPDSTQYFQVRQLTENTGKLLVPDKRTDLFQYELEGTNPVTINLETTIAGATTALQSAYNQAGLHTIIKTSLLPLSEPGAVTHGVVKLSVGNNRKTPDHAAEMVTQTILGTPLQILKKQRGYSLVRSPDNYISWLENESIALMEDSRFMEWEQEKKVVYTADNGFSYTEPNENSLRVSDLVKGNILSVTGKKGKYYHVLYPDGRAGYIHTKDAVDYKKWLGRPNPTASQILETAKLFVGVPYLWGGTSIKGVDCSGFTKSAYFLNGIVLPRDASQQALVGEAVDIYEADTVNLQKSLQNLKAGDLLFFASSKGRVANPRITHTAIYMGDGVFIQAAGLVRINSMIPSAGDYADFQSRTLVSARRMLTAVGSPQISRVEDNPFYRNTGKK